MAKVQVRASPIRQLHLREETHAGMEISTWPAASQSQMVSFCSHTFAAVTRACEAAGQEVGLHEASEVCALGAQGVWAHDAILIALGVYGSSGQEKKVGLAVESEHQIGRVRRVAG